MTREPDWPTPSVFFAFLCPVYCPAGGALDFLGAYDSAEEAKRRVEEMVARCDRDSDYEAHVAEWDGATLRVLEDWSTEDPSGWVEADDEPGGLMTGYLVR